jgi:acetaldehyde dehydrogenase/alcohol dehydrogenase
MHNASCLAGLAFTNSFLGINHSLAHKLGGEFHIPHGRANAILLPHVIAYNSQKPDKFTSFPKYERFVADERYAQIAASMDIPGSGVQERIAGLIKAVRELRKKLNVPSSIKECGIPEKDFFDRIGQLAENAFEDQCTTANPRYPLISDLKELYRKAYFDEE